MSIHKVSVDEADGHLAELIELVENGQEVVITQSNQAKIKLVACPVSKSSRVAGLHENAIQMREDFNEPLDDNLWIGSGH